MQHHRASSPIKSHVGLMMMIGKMSKVPYCPCVGVHDLMGSQLQSVPAVTGSVRVYVLTHNIFLVESRRSEQSHSLCCVCDA